MYFVLILLTLCMSFSLSYEALALLQDRSSIGVVFLLVIGAVVSYAIVFFNKFTTIVASIFALTTIILSVFLKKELSIPQNLLPKVGICLLISLIVYYFTVKKFNLYILGGIGFFLYCLQMIIQKTSGLGLIVFIITTLIYYFYNYYQTIPNRLGEISDMKPLHYIKVVASFLVISFMISLFFSQIIPLKLTLLHKIIDEKPLSISQIGKPYFPFQSALGGDIILDDTVVLEVNAPHKTYLRSRIKAIYTGESWTYADEESFLRKENDMIEDGEEWLTASKYLTNESIYDEGEMTITFKNLYTKSLFLPDKSLKFQDMSSNIQGYRVSGDTIYLEKPRGRDFSYQVKVYTPKYETKAFEDMLRKSYKGFYQELEGDKSAEYSKRAQEIQTIYTQLPPKLPRRIKDMALALTQNKPTMYDKVKVIEKYLATHYRYTLTPGPVQPNKDFVDEFLFEKHQGYCTYFATAMAVLTRSIGIPARYVEGYVLSNGKNWKTDNYIITNKQAHAWVEIYFEGAGWIRFEPTASYAPNTNKLEVGSKKPEELADIGKLIAAESQMQDSPTNRKHPTYLMLILSIGLVSVTGGSFLLYKGYQGYKYKHFEPKQAVVILYEKTLFLFKIKKMGIQVGETPLTFAQRIDTLIRFKQPSFKEITHIFLKAQYSQSAITKEEQEQVEHFYKMLRKAIKLYKQGLNLR